MQRIADHTPLRALFAPVAAGTAHHLIVEDFCTVVVVGPERRLEVADPSVVDHLLRLHENAAQATFAVVLRSYTGVQIVSRPRIRSRRSPRPSTWTPGRSRVLDATDRLP